MDNKDVLIKQLQKENAELKAKLKKFEKIEKHWDKMKKGLRTSEEIKDIDKIIKLRKDGVSIEKIAKELGVTRQTIINRLNKYKKLKSEEDFK